MNRARQGFTGKPLTIAGISVKFAVKSLKKHRYQMKQEKAPLYKRSYLDERL